jgi:hypothetical protein
LAVFEIEPVKKKSLTPLLFYSKIAKVIQMEKIVEQAMLYDFYGELLTDNQKSIYEDAVLNDYSLSEIAEEKGITRQGVHDTIKRCNKILEDYENKLHLLEKFLHTKNMVNEITVSLQEYRYSGDEACLDKIEQISREIVEDF